MILEAKNIRKTFGQDNYKVVAVNDISLEIEEGTLTAIVGRSGSGKSTLLHVLGGLVPPNKGEVLFNNQSLYTMSDDALTRLRRRHIGFIFQFFNLLSTHNVLENIILSLRLDHLQPDMDYIEDILTILGLQEKKNAFPYELSGGQQQRVAIARALASKSTLILADEPTGNLDAASSKEVVNLLKICQRKYHSTVVMVTHDELIASVADRVITIEDGKIIQDTKSI